MLMNYFSALTIVSGLLAFQQLSGINVVLFYSQSIFEKAGSSLDPAISTIIVGEFQLNFKKCKKISK
jgi:SP family facilitated glucose transporter-like MFS transporter 8